MSEDRVSRRACIAAGVTGLAALSGCPDDGGPATTGAAADRPTATADPAGDGTASASTAGSGEPADERTDTPAADAEPAVLVDQVGYRPGDEKHAVVRGDAESFTVRDAETDDEVVSGDLSDPVYDETAAETVRRATFDDLEEPGEYVVATDDGAVSSYPFRVDAGAWGQTLAEVGRRFTLRRANAAIDDPITGLDLDPGHPQDREARLYFGDDFHDEGEAVDVRGGWYDAGDYGKYVPPAAVSVAQFLLAYELFPDTFEPGQFAMPDGVSEAERAAGMPDVLAEAKFELEWLARMQRPDGAVYHKVAGTGWPAMDTRPADDAQTRYVFGLSTYGTAMTAGAMAMAARVFADVDAAFASEMEDGAVAAFDYLEDNPESRFRSDEGQNDGSGAYRKDADGAERFWAAAQLLKTTGDDRYERYVQGEAAGEIDSPATHVSWNDANLLGKWAYYTADAGSAEATATVADQITAAADGVVDYLADQGYRNSLLPSQFYWGSNKVALGRGVILLLADQVESSETYRRHARDQVHYVLGRSPTNRSYVTGSGEAAPENPHSRLVESTGINVPGNVVGGPNASGGDPDLDAYVDGENPAPAKSYLDVTGSYASNEPAIDYAAPLVPLLAAFTPADAVGVA